MTLWDMMSALMLITPFFVGIAEGKHHGLAGIVVGVVVGLCFGIVATVAFRKGGTLVFRTFPEQGRLPLRFAIVGWLFYLAAIIGVGLCGAAVLLVIKTIF